MANEIEAKIRAKLNEAIGGTPVVDVSEA